MDRSVMRRDGDRLTRSELKTARQRRNGEAVEDRSALQRLRDREPPSPEDVVRWNVEEALVLEDGYRIWRPPLPPSSLPDETSPKHAASLLAAHAKGLRPPRLLEPAIEAFLEALRDQGTGRFLNYAGRLRARLDEVVREAAAAEAAMPSPAIPPGVVGGALNRVAAAVVYQAARASLEGGQGTWSGLLEATSRMGLTDDSVLWWARILRAEGLLDFEGKDTVDPEAPVAIWVPPPESVGFDFGPSFGTRSSPD